MYISINTDMILNTIASLAFILIIIDILTLTDLRNRFTDLQTRIRRSYNTTPLDDIKKYMYEMDEVRNSINLKIISIVVLTIIIICAIGLSIGGV